MTKNHIIEFVLVEKTVQSEPVSEFNMNFSTSQCHASCSPVIIPKVPLPTLSLFLPYIAPVQIVAIFSFLCGNGAINSLILGSIYRQ